MTVTEGVTPESRTQLPDMDVPGRLDRLRVELEASECDALVVSELTNIRYLTGFTGSAAILVVTPEDSLFVSDGRYCDQAGAELGAAGVATRIEIVPAAPDEVAAAMVADAGARRVGLEADTVTWSQQRRWSGELLADLEVLPTRSLVEGLRLIKDPGEAARIRAACAIADQALASVAGRLLEGPSETEFGQELDATMRRLGADDLSFETIVASGPNGARPHHHPGDRRIADGDLVVVDFGALVEGYHSDMTRTFAVGEVGAERERMLEVVATAQQVGVETVAAGRDAAEVDAACREVIDEAGWADAFAHSTGHGVGLDIHEEPRVSSRSTATLVPGHVITVEPGVYLSGLGGVRVEDTVLVTEDGCERLTLAPKQPRPA